MRKETGNDAATAPFLFFPEILGNRAGSLTSETGLKKYHESPAEQATLGGKKSTVRSRKGHSRREEPDEN